MLVNFRSYALQLIKEIYFLETDKGNECQQMEITKQFLLNHKVHLTIYIRGMSKRV